MIFLACLDFLVIRIFLGQGVLGIMSVRKMCFVIGFFFAAFALCVLYIMLLVILFDRFFPFGEIAVQVFLSTFSLACSD
jgi:hypothetical protein